MRYAAVIRVALSVALVTGAAGLAHHRLEALLPGEGEVAAGVLVDGVAVGPGQSIDDVVARAVAARQAQPLRLTHEGETVLEGTLGELGVELDTAHLRAALGRLAHDGTVWDRIDDARQASAGHVAITLPFRLPLADTAERLVPFKRRWDQPPRDARWSFAESAVVPHAPGRRVHVSAAVDAMQAAAARGQTDVRLVVEEVAPEVTAEVAASIDRSAVVSEYVTRYGYVGNQVGRAQNIHRAAEAIDGLVLVPGQTIAFNDLVGPRSVDNGFATAGEIYKGEMRLGIGGGTCQVASTLHAAAYFGGLGVVERSPHSRPSGYIPIGLDATVAYPHVDLKLKNRLPFPVIVRAESDKGTLTVRLLGRQRPEHVAFRSATVGIKPYARKVREASWLPEGRVIQKQKGLRGITVKKLLEVRYKGGPAHEEETTDVYPPTNEVYIIGPGIDRDKDLPPLPGADGTSST